MEKLKNFMSKITESTIKVLTIAGYVALGIVIASVLIYLFSDLTIADKNEVERYNNIKDQAVEQMLDQPVKK